jgi:hypothetical protein
MIPGYSFLGGLNRPYSSALLSGTITPFCSGSGCLAQRESTRRAARLPAARWSASARAGGDCGARTAAGAGERSAGLGTCESRAGMATAQLYRRASARVKGALPAITPTRSPNSVRVGSA